jgi:two-component system chemotaxis response regulator CheY
VRMSGLEFERTEEAGNGVEALEKLKAGPVDVMLCDINMPEMNGAELVKKARELPTCAHTRIVMVSTESAQDLMDQLLANGADGYITKPFTPERFREKLTPLLN